MNLSGTGEAAIKRKSEKKAGIIIILQYICFDSHETWQIVAPERSFYNVGELSAGVIAFHSENIYIYICQRINFSEPTFLWHHWIELAFLIMKHD